MATAAFGAPWGRMQGAATQTAPRRPNPEGTGGLRLHAALLVVSDGNPSLPPRALPEAASPLCAAMAISRTGS
jgi:hypothetical protein